MNSEVHENNGLNTADAASREFSEACYILWSNRGSYVDARLFPSYRAL
jgi:hypothetical protein